MLLKTKKWISVSSDTSTDLTVAVPSAVSGAKKNANHTEFYKTAFELDFKMNWKLIQI